MELNQSEDGEAGPKKEQASYVPSVISTFVSARLLDTDLCDRSGGATGIKNGRDGQWLVKTVEIAQELGRIGLDGLVTTVKGRKGILWHHFGEGENAKIGFRDADGPPVPIGGVDVQVKNEFLVGGQDTAHLQIHVGERLGVVNSDGK